MLEPDKLYDELEKYISELEQEFISEFIPADPDVPYSKYEHKVKAYCVLSHAAFEEFFETIAISVMHESIELWVVEKRATDSLITLVNYVGPKLETENYDKNSADHIQGVIEYARTVFTKKVTDNHGAAIKYIGKLLIPVALDVSSDPNVRNSLSQLSSNRGEFAHRGRVKTILSPEDAKNYVTDCLQLCEDIREKVKRKFV